MNSKNALSAVKFYYKKYGFVDTTKKVFSSLFKRTFKNNSYNYQDKEYQVWISNNEPTEEELEEQRNISFDKNPKISIVVPMYNTNLDYIKDLVDSVIKQTYSNWELCLADGSEEHYEVLDDVIDVDDRIKYKQLNNNFGIAGNSNEAIKMADGDYIALLDHDDTIPPFCLYEIVKTINENPEVEFIYSDEDKIEDGNRCQVHFKPDFAIDTLRSNNYITHLSVFKKELVDRIGGFRPGYDGAQDFDIILRAAENTKNIIHIPKVLYHWRIDSNSTAMLSASKPYAYRAGIRVIEDHLKRQELKAKVTPDKDIKGVYEIDYELNNDPRVLIAIKHDVNKKGKALYNCVKQIKTITTYDNYFIEKVTDNEDYYKNLNELINEVECDYIMLIDENLKVTTPDWLEKFIGYAQRNDVGIVSGKIYYNNNKIEHAGVEIGTDNMASNMYELTPKNIHAYFGRESTTRNVSAVSEKCLFTKKELFNEVGQFDIELKDYSSLDYCLKVRQKEYLIVYNPYVEFIDSINSNNSLNKNKNKNNENDENKEKLEKAIKEKWADVLTKKDMYSNINFTSESANSIIKK